MYALLVVSALLSSARAAPVAVDRTFPASALPKVRVEVLCGSVSVKGAARETVHLTGTVGNLEWLRVDEGSSTVAIEVAPPSRNKSAKDRQRRDNADGAVIGQVFTCDSRADCNSELWCADLVLEVPVASRFSGDTISADIQVEGVSGAIDLDTVSGDSRVRGGPGDVTVDTVSGAVQVETVSGTEVSVDTVSSAVVVRGAPRSVSVDAVSGRVRVESLELARLDVDTVSGPIDVRGLLSEMGVWTVDVYSGPVVVNVLPGSNATIEGEMSFGEPTLLGHASADRVVLGAGAGRLEISSYTGKISVISKE